jgi:arginyl-tRNA synthetase
VELDIELAKKNSLDNPVFYIQMGHARLASILAKGVELNLHPSHDEWAKLTHPDELSLIRKLADYTQVVQAAAMGREPHRVLFFVEELARDFQSYYTVHKNDPVLPPKSVREKDGWESSWDMAQTRARLGWIEAMKIVYASALGLLGISAPERMIRPEVAGSAEAEAEQD